MNEYIIKLQQFLAEEVELLEDFAMDVDDSNSDGKAYSQAAALWSMQTSRVAAIRAVFEILQIEELEQPEEHYCSECGEATLYLASDILKAKIENSLENAVVECEKCRNITRY